METSITEKLAAALCALMLVVAFIPYAAPSLAVADEPDTATDATPEAGAVTTDENGYTRVEGAPDTTNAELTDLQKQIEASNAEYEQAVANQGEMQKRIDENKAKIDDLNKQIPVQQGRTADAVKNLYVIQQEGYGLLDAVLSSDSLADFLNKVEYIDCIQSHNSNELQKLDDMKSELQAAQTELDEDKKQADEETDRAQRSLEQAQQARKEAQDRAIAEAQAAAAAAAAEAAAAQAAAAEQAGADGEAGDGGGFGAPTADVNWDVGRDAFIAEWTGRIDAYLAGSPLAGCGASFATAAWDYGVDPRWSPAISNTESSKGLYCFQPHNAWGWGSSGWGSWDEAIDAHVRGLARGYGYTISLGAAQKYCPPNYAHWYSSTLSQMNMI